MQEMLEVRLKESKFEVNNDWMDDIVVSEEQINTTEVLSKGRNSTVCMVQQSQQQSLQAHTLQSKQQQQQNQQKPLQQQLTLPLSQSLQSFHQGRYQTQNKNNKSLYSTASQASQNFIIFIIIIRLNWP